MGERNERGKLEEMGESRNSPIVVRSFEPFVPLPKVDESSNGSDPKKDTSQLRVLMRPVSAPQNDSDGNYFKDVIYFETSLCCPFHFVNWGQKPNKYMYIEDVIQFYSDKYAGLIRCASYYNDKSLAFW